MTSLPIGILPKAVDRCRSSLKQWREAGAAASTTHRTWSPGVISADAFSVLSNGFVRRAQAVGTSLSSRREDRLPQPWRKLSILTPLAAIEFVWLARNCSFAEFLFSGDRFSMHSFNSIPHLDDRRLLTYR